MSRLKGDPEYKRKEGLLIYALLTCAYFNLFFFRITYTSLDISTELLTPRSSHPQALLGFVERIVLYSRQTPYIYTGAHL